MEQRHPDFLSQMKLLFLRSSAICFSNMVCTFQVNQQDEFDQFVQIYTDFSRELKATGLPDISGI